MFNFLKKLFKPKTTPIVEEIIIPKYVKKLEDKFNISLEDEYLSLINDGITGKKIVGRTLYLHAKSLK